LETIARSQLYELFFVLWTIYGVRWHKDLYSAWLRGPHAKASLPGLLDQMIKDTYIYYPFLSSKNVKIAKMFRWHMKFIKGTIFFFSICSQSFLTLVFSKYICLFCFCIILQSITVIITEDIFQWFCCFYFSVKQTTTLSNLHNSFSRRFSICIAQLLHLPFL